MFHEQLTALLSRRLSIDQLCFTAFIRLEIALLGNAHFFVSKSIFVPEPAAQGDQAQQPGRWRKRQRPLLAAGLEVEL